ncbi:MAG: hypothetical protein CVU91_08980 [Firmicutes bacterium HGW-Firmicutes-16]|nr:MAG: hypothetical protein CVU91_08980 [Firmicutes bacterium HGW-Firmicutes-16]
MISDKQFVDSHAYIIASPDVERREKKALDIACYFLCEGQAKRPCMECPACRNVLAGFHPDIIDVSRKSDDKGNKKRDIQVEQIRHMASDAYVRPSQADKKVYLIRDAGTMNISAQNAALKILEEPPEYAVFILCTDSAESLLATVRSRCTAILLTGEKLGNESELAEEYITLAAKRDEAKLCTFFGKHEALDTERVGEFVSDVRFCLNSFISLKKKYNNLTREDAFRLLSLCDRADDYLRLNVSAKHVMGLLCVLTI